MRLIKLVCTYCLLLVSGPVLAWGDLGHETIGELATRHMKPETRHFVDHYLKQNLAMAAVAPDKVKSDPFFTGDKAFNTYHYVNIERIDGNGDIVLAQRDRSALVLLDSAYGILSNAESDAFDDYQKKLLLQYIIHVVGDLQQPLHAGYAHDKGANDCSVKYLHPYYKKEIPTNLHAIWDTDILENYARLEFYGSNPAYKWFGYVQLADIVEKEVQKIKGKVQLSTEVSDWLKDSVSYHDRAYPNVAAGDTYHLGTDNIYAYCGFKKTVGSGTKRIDPISEAIPLIDKGFAKPAFNIIKNRLAIGGLRLANYLDQIAANACNSQPDLCGLPHKDNRKALIYKLWEYIKI